LLFFISPLLHAPLTGIVDCHCPEETVKIKSTSVLDCPFSLSQDEIKIKIKYNTINLPPTHGCQECNLTQPPHPNALHTKINICHFPD